MRTNIFIRGFLTGMFLQLAIGPVFVFILNIAFQQGLVSGLVAVMAVTLVDYLYIILAVVGVGRMLESERIKKLFGFASSAVLVLFGILLIKKAFIFAHISLGSQNTTTLFGAFAAAFFLTISSPLTILFWTGIFANKTIEYSLNRSELVVFGLAAGAATFIFLGTAVVLLSSLTLIVPVSVFRVLNAVVGTVLIFFALMRIIQLSKPKKVEV